MYTLMPTQGYWYCTLSTHNEECLEEVLEQQKPQKQKKGGGRGEKKKKGKKST